MELRKYLPPNTTLLIQPKDQDIICPFKALYIRNALQHLVEGVDSDQDFSLKAYWLGPHDVLLFTVL
uniref:DDE-1 domain-containing protein n=1 Tax=Poecilia reticulata TaxID=8081 RepID=A0A3P9QH16_POERE